MSLKLLLVGSGKMGQAMLGGWVEGEVSPSDIAVIDPNSGNLAVAAGLGCRGYAEPSQIPADFAPDVMVLAVKPQMMGEVLPAYRAFAEKGAPVISIAAGTRIESFEAAFGDSAAIIRVMPNTPAAIRKGMLVCCANSKATDAHQEICTRLMSAIGDVSWIEDEALMDAVTGLSGSGPAYVFYMIETMTAAGIAAGLPEDLAVKLATGTVAGAGALARMSGESAAVLRQNVTSPNGTTAAGLEVLMSEDGLAPLMKKTVAAATDRSKELG
ncbi:MAG: pyrroline-5-carboxylate reductase [Alphaproteobacteria bacterium]|nr:MAG: pyrroline-5-carboxylate reductase [Alphaproteobacteria bacterium]